MFWSFNKDYFHWHWFPRNLLWLKWASCFKCRFKIMSGKQNGCNFVACRVDTWWHDSNDRRDHDGKYYKRVSSHQVILLSSWELSCCSYLALLVPGPQTTSCCWRTLISFHPALNRRRDRLIPRCLRYWRSGSRPGHGHHSPVRECHLNLGCGAHRSHIRNARIPYTK